jgi:hypothetical protein
MEIVYNPAVGVEALSTVTPALEWAAGILERSAADREQDRADRRAALAARVLDLAKELAAEVEIAEQREPGRFSFSPALQVAERSRPKRRPLASFLAFFRRFRR